LDLPFHDLTKPSWGRDNTLVYGGPGKAPRLNTSILINVKSALPGGHNEVKFAKLNGPSSAIPNTITEQRDCTSVTVEDDTIPRARTTSEFNFMKFASATQVNTPAGEHECAVWQLASILFDDLQGSMPVGPLQESITLYQSRVRKDKLSDFWKKLVQAAVENDAQNAKSSEEKAFIYLTGGNVPEACAALLSGQNFHLAQMVAQIGGDKTFRKAVEKQLNDWRELNVLSEMNDPIRAIYGLLAGQTCNYPGKTGVAAEDRATSWPYSARFELDWKRSFGLRLWYGILDDEDLAYAVRQFKTDFRKNGEIATPVPWFHDDNDDVWSDPKPDSREDALWGLLKLYADDYARDGRALTSLKSALAPENISGNPMDPRLSFQLLHLLRAIGVGTSFNPHASEKENAIVNADDDVEATASADQLALLYATSLTSQISFNPDNLPVACWVLLHISNVPTRTKMIRSLLDQHANILNPGEPLFTSLTADLHIPPSWIYISKALYAQAVECSPVSEARWLIEAHQLHRAHAVLCHVIGPAAIIARDYDPLREILGALVATDIARKVDWAKGGGLYFDFVELADLEGSSRRNAHSRKQVVELVRKLSASLEAVAGEVRGGERGDMERIALQIMAEWILDIGEREGVSSSLSFFVPPPCHCS
jgi:nuclear pore complex protein Nup98-Nup96